LAKSKIKSLIINELSKENSDSNLILELTHQLANFDKDVVRFSIDANLISRLGKELVGRHETAVSELVKNAFDADALNVDLTFENEENVGGSIIIEDDGLGMTKDQLISGFMRLASTDKIHNPVSLIYKRKKAGKKGIGRFATQRLGEKLTIITQTADNDHANKVSIDWTNFEMDKDLYLITSTISTIPKTKDQGTTLIIDKLRDAWTDSMLKKSYRYSLDLLQPFPLSKVRKKEEKNRIDPGFKISYFKKSWGKNQPIINDQEAFFQHALAEIEGYVLDDGQGMWSMMSSLLNFEEEIFSIGKQRDDVNSKFDFIRNVHFKCYYFIYEPSLLPQKTLSFIKSVANESGGIRLYRNGFRVLPYGEKGNDWIGLDESTRRRGFLAPHQNISFFGFVEITDAEGIVFEETSSREGLIENSTVKELEDFVFRVITTAVVKIAEIRKRKGTAGQKDWEKQSEKFDFDKILSELERLANESDLNKTEDTTEKKNKDSLNDSNKKLKDAITLLKEGREKEKVEIKDVIEELNMQRILAGLGLVIGEFVHEIDRFLPAFDTDIRYLRSAVSDMVDPLKRVERIDENLKSFSTYTAYFYETISRNVLRELAPIELRDVVYEFEDVIKENIKQAGIILHAPIFEEYDLWTRPMHKSEWAAILFNLYINSKKAIKRRSKRGEILIRCGKENDFVFLEFSDNGDGIPKENVERIFDAFFTTTSAAGRSASDDEALTGIGLGLKIIKDIVESYGGDVYLSESQQPYTTTIRIEIPQNKELDE
jgi:signal transduction histidine kinase